jgi:predicted secreted protein
VGNVEVVRLRPGERHRVTLPGLGTAGYVWSQETTGDAAEVTKETTGPGQESTERDLGPPVGRSNDEVFTVTAKHPGTADIRFVQARPWEKASLHERVLRVVVAEGDG